MPEKLAPVCMWMVGKCEWREVRDSMWELGMGLNGKEKCKCVSTIILLAEIVES